MADYTLELNNVSKGYVQGNKKLEVLQGLNLHIKKGEMVALVGQSGSGKSTLLQIAGLLDAPDSGDVIYLGKNLSSAGDKERTLVRRNKIGFVFQFHHLLPDFSALENIMFPNIIGGKGREFARKRALELLDGFGLKDRANHRPAELSGGEQQRVAILRAITHNPEMLLADEPTGNLDPQTSDIVFDALVNAVRNYGLSALIATHNMELASRMDRVITLKHSVS
jgi:lipoprotein-releasing system ATP-binding protein